MSARKKIAVIGATGYTGQELVRILLGHQDVSISALTSRKDAGTAYSKMFPGFKGIRLPALSIYEPKKTLSGVSLAFFCLPHGESHQAVGKAVDMGVKAVDLSADFRLRSMAEYKRWYGKHSRPDLIKKAVYGLPELYREKIKRAVLVANPGCYPTGVILGVAPLVRAGLVDTGHVIADMKSGVSGAGRKGTFELSYCETNEDMRAYSLYRHRHGPEMEQELTRAAGKKVRVTFSPHLAPMNRGILGTIYLTLKKKCAWKDLHGALDRTYVNEPFIRLLPEGELPSVARVRGTNFVDIAVTMAPGGREAIVSTALDNLVKGASGAAVQNMNLMLGLPETRALLAGPLKP